MSVIKNQKRKTFVIAYYALAKDGKNKQFKIYNKDWKYSVGIKHIRSIEQEEIEKDKKRRSLFIKKENFCFKDLANEFLEEYSTIYKNNTVYNTKLIINKHMNFFTESSQSLDQSLSADRVKMWAKQINEVSLSNDRKNRIKEKFQQILLFAMQHDYLSMQLYNKDLLLIKKTKNIDIIKTKDNFWTENEFVSFISTFSSNQKEWKLLFEVCYWAALRVGELLALKWEDIDLNFCTVNINKEITSRGFFDTPKNKASIAKTSLPKGIISKLQNYKNQNHFSNDDFVFFGCRPTSRTTMRRIMNQHIKIANVKKITIHGLRHSMASYMINKGIDIMVISKHLRHSSTRQTYDTYCHLFPNLHENDLEKIYFKS